MAMPSGLKRYWAKHRKGSKSKSKRGYSMAKRYSHHKAKMTIPLAVVAGFASPVGRTIQHLQTSGLTGEEGAIAEFSRTMIGINPYSSSGMKFEAWRLRYGLMPVAVGLLVHKAANFVGLNRMLARSGIPLIRI